MMVLTKPAGDAGCAEQQGGQEQGGQGVEKLFPIGFEATLRVDVNGGQGENGEKTVEKVDSAAGLSFEHQPQVQPDQHLRDQQQLADQQGAKIALIDRQTSSPAHQPPHTCDEHKIDSGVAIRAWISVMVMVYHPG